MPEIDRLGGGIDWIDLDFVERERTPEPIIEVGVQLHVAGLSLSNTKQYLENLGIERSRTAIHNWVQKADLQPASDANPNQIAVDETVIRVNGERHWLYAAVDPEMNEFRTFGCFRRRRRSSRYCFSVNYKRNSRSSTPPFSSMRHIIASLHSSSLGSDFRCVATEIGTVSNVSLER